MSIVVLYTTISISFIQFMKINSIHATSTDECLHYFSFIYEMAGESFELSVVAISPHSEKWDALQNFRKGYLIFR